MGEIVWTEEAVQWLEEIFEHIAADNPHAATSVTSSIFERAQILRDFPHIGYLYRKEEEGEIRLLCMAIIGSPISSASDGSTSSEYFTLPWTSVGSFVHPNSRPFS